jgi:phosphoglucomutase
MSQNRAGTRALPEDLINVDQVVSAYYDVHPDPSVAAQRVAFGTSGHRGSSLKASFNEDHILAITQAIVEYRRSQGITGPLFLGKDTHALSDPAQDTALEVLAANDVTVLWESNGDFAPTPAVSFSILSHNSDPHIKAQADGIIITPSHNPPA